MDLYKPRCLRRRLDARLRRCGAGSYREYLALLRSDPAEAERLVEAITIQVSRFFRNPESFRALERRVLPALVAAASAASRPVRIWSAGTADGEEAYTLAILWERATAGLAEPPPLALVASDVDAAALARARAGLYDGAALADLAPRDRARHFSPEGGAWRVRPRLRGRVQFRRADLTAPLRTRFQDLVVCRNVMIYFERELQEALCRELHLALRPGGFLMLGKTESLPPRARALFEPVDVRERLYRRHPTPGAAR